MLGSVPCHGALGKRDKIFAGRVAWLSRRLDVGVFSVGLGRPLQCRWREQITLAALLTLAQIKSPARGGSGLTLGIKAGVLRSQKTSQPRLWHRPDLLTRRRSNSGMASR